MSPDAAKSRVAYIDWMRGLACVLMFQTHCYDSWLGGTARQSRFFMDSQLLGTFPAPLFLFLAGISFALVTVKLQQKGMSAEEIARSTIRRGAEIFGFGLLFRLQEYLIAWGWAPKSDLFRVDILNTIGVSMMLMGVMCCGVMLVWGQPPKPALSEGSEPNGAVLPGAPGLAGFARPGKNVHLILSATAAALLISLFTPFLWTSWAPRWLPWPLESYINGVHNLGTPQPWLFPIFPWTGFAFAGLAVGFVLQSDWAKARGGWTFAIVAAAGVVLFELSRVLDRLSLQLYPVYDYWHTSPNFFLIRVGMLLMIVAGSYAWCRWGAGEWGFSPLIQLGQASLVVYWVHIEFVYGRVSILRKHSHGIGGATLGLLIIFLAMLALAYARTHMKGWRKDRSKGKLETANAAAR